MDDQNPVAKPKAEYQELIEQISVADSPVGIDAQYTHAIIIEYLRQISSRLAKIEAKLESHQPPA